MTSENIDDRDVFGTGIGPPGSTWGDFDERWGEPLIPDGEEDAPALCMACGDDLKPWKRLLCTWCRASTLVSGQPDHVTRISNDGVIAYVHRFTGEVRNTLPLPVLDGD